MTTSHAQQDLSLFAQARIKKSSDRNRSDISAIYLVVANAATTMVGEQPSWRKT